MKIQIIKSFEKGGPSVVDVHVGENHMEKAAEAGVTPACRVIGDPPLVDCTFGASSDHFLELVSNLVEITDEYGTSETAEEEAVEIIRKYFSAMRSGIEDGSVDETDTFSGSLSRLLTDTFRTGRIYAETGKILAY